MLLFLGLSLKAQAPQGFNYQATVRNASGDLVVNQNVSFSFDIIQGSQTADPTYSEDHTLLTDDLGQVSLVIGQGTPTTGVFSEIDWSIGNYYLAIELDTGNGFEPMGTSQLLSVPYAMYSNSSGSLPQGMTQGDILIWDATLAAWTISNNTIHHQQPLQQFQVAMGLHKITKIIILSLRELDMKLNLMEGIQLSKKVLFMI